MGGHLKGAFDFHLQFTTDSHTLRIGDAVPDERAGRVTVEPAGVGDAGFNRGGNCTVCGNPGSVEVIE